MARGALREAEIKAATATQRAEEIARLRRDVNERRSVRDRLSEALTTSRLGREEARALADQTARAESDMEVRWRHAHAVAQEARREDAAAAAAVGCVPGGPCPVCARELPAGFVPPAPSTGASGAEATEQILHNELDACRRAAARAEATFETRASEEASVAGQLGDAVTAVADAERQRAAKDEAGEEDVIAAADATRARLEEAQRAERAGSDSLAQARADVSATEGAIEPLAATAQRAVSTLTRATSDRDEAAETSDRCRGDFVGAGGDVALMRAQTDLRTTIETLANSKSPLDAAERSVDDAETRLNSAGRRAAALGAAETGAIAHRQLAMEAAGTAVTAIPAAARQGESDDPPAVAETAERWVAERRALIAEAAQRQTDAEAAFDQAQSAAAILRRRRATELEPPSAEARSAGTRLAGIAEVSSPAADLGPAGLAAWATVAAAETRERAEEQRREADAADAEADRARRRPEPHARRPESSAVASTDGGRRFRARSVQRMRLGTRPPGGPRGPVPSMQSLRSPRIDPAC